MFSKEIRLKSIDDIKKFVSAVSGCAYDVDMMSGRYQVDAKSIMGIFSLDLSSPVKVILMTNDEKESKPFLDFLDGFSE